MKYLLFISICCLFISCKKEGCTSPLALNYNSEAEKDNGTCEFPENVDITRIRFDDINSIIGTSLDTRIRVKQYNYDLSQWDTIYTSTIKLNNSSGFHEAIPENLSFSGSSLNHSISVCLYSVGWSSDNQIASGSFNLSNAPLENNYAPIMTTHANQTGGTVTLNLNWY